MVTPAGIVTFLFTDIEGSTRRWESDADGMRTALTTHDDLMRETVAANDGWLFKHTGDGVCAAFSSPRSAVDAGIAAQRALELPVRMGIATGAAEVRGDDYFGPVLNRAARVMAAGHGGQILLDGATAELLSGADLADLGARRLRDIARPVSIFQVRADGLRTDFSPLRTLDSTPGNLRSPTTTLIGRESELADVSTTLKAHRLVTLTGVGGVGKTRLALEVAARMGHGFRDGVWVIELAAVGDPAAVPEAVAAALGITQQPGLTLSDSVAMTLEGRSRLLVFDNCEHLLNAAADMIEAILARSEDVRILVTSREGLRLGDEYLWPVPSLDVDSSAATLFVERASAVSPAVSLDNDTNAVVEICRRLDGIPLAIELAASRLLSMTVSEVRDFLDDRFRLLVGSRRGLERHQTLRHAVQWSYDLLDADEKTLLNRCSVFAGGFDLAGAQAVGRSSDKFTTLDLLDALVRKSLLIADQSSGRTRFKMLETIRQFAEEQLVQNGEADDARNAHARYFAGRETDVLALWDSPRQREAYDWFTTELANMRSAFRWAADREDLDSASAVAVTAAFVGVMVEQYEPVSWVEELIEPSRAAGHRRLPQLYRLASQCYTTGRLDDALRYADMSLAVDDTEAPDTLPVGAEFFIGGVYMAHGQPDRWVELCRDAVARSSTPDISSRICLAVALSTAGAVEEAIAASRELPAIADATGNPNLASNALLAYGLAHHYVDPAASFDAHRRGMKIAYDSGNRQLESYHSGSLSVRAWELGKPAEALDYVTIALSRFYNTGHFSVVPSAFGVMTSVLDGLGIYEPAAVISAGASTPFTSTSYPEIHDAVGHLREVLGNEHFETLSRRGESLSITAMAEYAFEQIDLARARLDAES